MKSNSSPRSIRYSAPEDAGMQITTEILKILAVVVGVAFTPILLRILMDDRFLQFQPWFWVVGAALGLILILFGSIYAFRQARQSRRLQALRAPRRLLLERLLPPFQIEIFTRASPEKTPDALPEALATKLARLQATLPWTPGYELLPPFGYRVHPDPLQTRALAAGSEAEVVRKLEALRLMRQSGQIDAGEFEEMKQSIQRQNQTQDTDQKLQALKAMQAAGLMTRADYKARVKEIQQTTADGGQHQETWLILPTLLITLGGFVLLYAVVAFLMQRNDVAVPQLIALYFSSPVFLIWITTEILYAYPLFFVKAYRQPAHIVGVIKASVQIVAALLLWFFLGLYFGIPNIDILFYIGAGVAGLGLILGIVSASLNRRLAREPFTFPDVPADLPAGQISTSAPTGAEPAAATGQDGAGVAEQQVEPLPANPDQAAASPVVPLADPLPQAGYFHLYQEEDNAYYFRLIAGEDLELLFNSGQASHRDCLDMIAQVKQHAPIAERYRREQTPGNLGFFLLTGRDQDILAMSQPVNNEARLAWLIAACQLLAYTAPIRDETDASSRKSQIPVLPQAGRPAAEENEAEVSAPPEVKPLNGTERPSQPPEEATEVIQPAAGGHDPSREQEISSSLVQDPDPGEPLLSPVTPPSGNPEQKLDDDSPSDPVPAEEATPTPPVRAPKFQLFPGQDEQYYFRLLAKNGEIVLASEGYTRRESAVKGIRSVQKNGSQDKRFRRKTAKNGQYYFTLAAGNHEVIGKSELYKTAQGRDRGIAAVQRIAAAAPIEILPKMQSNQVETVTQPDPPPDPQEEKGTMKGPKFTIFPGTNNQFYFRLVAGNNEIVLGSEAYTTKKGCQNGIRSVKANARLDKRYRRQIAKNGQHYFELVAGNHQVIGVSELYTTTQSCEKGIAAVQRIAADAPVEDLT